MADRHKNSRRGTKGTGHADPSKDRSAHETGRGKPAKGPKTLGHLSRAELSVDDLEAAWDELEESSDRAAAIVGAAFVEEELVQLIQASLVRPSDKAGLFYSDGALFRTFLGRIRAAYALGLIDDPERDDLDRIRDIRNQFAHSLKTLSFEHADLQATCRLFAYHAKTQQPADFDRWSARQRYNTACKQLGLVFVRAQTMLFKRAMARLASSPTGSGVLSQLAGIGDGNS
ncbi:MAG: hypothetical protein V4659_01915 [Pseudomonadota bacterium]